MLSKRVPGFKPSASAFHFGNEFDEAPVLTIPVDPFGDIPVGNASGGMCGGMVFSVVDMFERGLTPPTTRDAPKPDTPLFNYIAGRLVTSFNGVGGVLKYLAWMRMPDAARFLGLRKSIAWHSVNDEWPAIKSDLDDGQLCPLGLIKIQSHNPFDLGANHQVLAYGYDYDDSNGDLKILVYDPNFPNVDDVTLSLNMVDEDDPSPITYSADPAGRGFFRTKYDAEDPSDALATA